MQLWFQLLPLIGGLLNLAAALTNLVTAARYRRRGNERPVAE